MLIGSTESTKYGNYVWDLFGRRAEEHRCVCGKRKCDGNYQRQHLPTPHFERTSLSPVADENKLKEPRIANEPRAAKEPEARHSKLLHQVDNGLRRLAMPEAYLVDEMNMILTFHEAVESPLRNQWIDKARRLEEHY